MRHSQFKSVFTQLSNKTHDNNKADIMFTVMDYLPAYHRQGKSLCKFIFTNLDAMTCREKWIAANLGILHDLPHMLSQNRARVLGFSWLRRCLNQRCMVLTSQSSCLDRPSNLFSSGCWQHKINTQHVRCRVHRGANAMR